MPPLSQKWVENGVEILEARESSAKAIFPIMKGPVCSKTEAGRILLYWPLRSDIPLVKLSSIINTIN